jgi:hypothetical protein
MSRWFLLCLLTLTLGACGGSDGGDDSVGPDAADSPDSAEGAVCTGAAYDSCQDTVGWTDCLDGMECRLFMQQGFTICTPSCDASNPCPDQDGVPVSCNQMGRCRGDHPNDCSLP